ncbi:MAG: hypothetical protein IH899_02005 [Planctomycetes bacterium]|nr:hypothetical protein [Planctomycetota bacterium]
MKLTERSAKCIVDATCNQSPVSGLTHDFYRYPARFSPIFAAAAIGAFTEPGDTVLDPFLGGGTTLVEGCVSGRTVVGTDISALATFVSRVKTTPITRRDATAIGKWGEDVSSSLKIHRCLSRSGSAIRQDSFPNNMSTVEVWRIRKLIELALDRVSELCSIRQREFARCSILRAAQWALDCRTQVPSVMQFRHELSQRVKSMITGSLQFREDCRAAWPTTRGRPPKRCHILNASACDLPQLLSRLSGLGKAKLVLTSPPYPGVYVLYHRWKIRGRWETPAPFWISNQQDGHGHNHYLMHNRKEDGLHKYFENIRNAFAAVRLCIDKKAVVVQLIAFKDPSWQVPAYLRAMEDAGYVELSPESLGIRSQQRLRRSVPGRRWFAIIQGDLKTSDEYVLFHQPK